MALNENYIQETTLNQSSVINVLKYNTKYAIVKFTELTHKENNLVDIVPRSWIFEHNYEWKCFVPPRKDIINLKSWIKDSHIPGSTWTSHFIKILKEASSYEQAIRRLERNFTNYPDLISSSAEDIVTDDIQQHYKEPNTFIDMDSLTLVQPFASPNNSEETSIIHSNIDIGRGVKRKKRSKHSLLNINNEENDSSESIYLNNENITNQKNEDILNCVKEEIRKAEKKLTKQFCSLKRSLLYDFKKHFTDIKNSISPINGIFGIDSTHNKEILGITELPFTLLEMFMQFDESLQNNIEKETAMKSFMTTLSVGQLCVSKSINRILSTILSKDVQLLYSACGKKIRGNVKKNFSNTNTYNCLKDVLCQKHEVSESEMISKLSRWFTGAIDRDGGRKRRSTE